MKMDRKAHGVALAVGTGFLLAACGLDVKPDYIDKRGDDYKYESDRAAEKNNSIFGGESGFNLLDLGKGKANEGGGGIGVNSYLWRASLDTIAFMPLASADPFGGVIITDWYSPPEAPQERYKMSVYILGRELRADGVKVAVFRQRLNGGGGWADSAINKDTAINLENQILSRARQLRVARTQK